MKIIMMVLCTTSVVLGQAGTCQGIDVGSSLYGHVSWHGFVAGSATSTYRRNISNDPVEPNSPTWLNRLALSAHNTYLHIGVATSELWNSAWEGFVVQYVHGNSQRRVPVRYNPPWSKTSSAGSMTAGSATLTVIGWNPGSIQGRQRAYFQAQDVGLEVSVSGACSETSSSCMNGVLGGNPGSVFISSVISPTQVLVSAAATTSTRNATVNVEVRQGSNSTDPGTFPMPLSPRIQSWYGPHSRPFGPFLDTYLNPNFTSDQHAFVVDVDDCIGYDLYQCYDDLSNLSCGAYAAFSLSGGDVQRPYNMTGGATVAGMPDIPGMLRYDEFSTGVIAHALNITALAGNLTPAFTGPASYGQYGSWVSNQIPFGSKLRMKPQSLFDTSSYPASCAPLLTEMRNYGLIIVDGGFNGQIVQQTGYSWPYDCAYYMYANLAINTTSFEVVKQPVDSHIYCANRTVGCPDTMPTGSAPTILSFTASPATIMLGQSTTLHWGVTGVVDIDATPPANNIPLRNISFGPNHALDCSAQACSLGPGWINGPLHGESIIMTPQSSGTYVYQLMVQNRYGRTKANVTVTVGN